MCPFSGGADADGAEDNQARREIAVEGGGIEDIEAIVDQGKQHDSSNAAPDCANPAINACAAQNNGCNGILFHPCACRSLAHGHS